MSILEDWMLIVVAPTEVTGMGERARKGARVLELALLDGFGRESSGGSSAPATVSASRPRRTTLQ